MNKNEAISAKKKTSISKGQLKKTIKNILCRVDGLHWPEISIVDAKLLEAILNRYKVNIPIFEKPHWNEIKHLPKDERPKPPKLEKVNGLLFGISECNNSILNGQCAAVAIEATVNPRIIVQSVIESCVKKDIPVVCMKDLKQVCAANFGIPTSCLGVRTNLCTDLHETISKISSRVKQESNNTIDRDKIDENEDKVMLENTVVSDDNKIEEMDTTDKAVTPTTKLVSSECPYLYRTSKNSRVFVPHNKNISEEPKKFIGQDKISFSKHTETDENLFKNMLLKRISNNPYRMSKKKRDKLKKNKEIKKTV